MKRIIAVTALAALTLTSCVSKKKYLAATNKLEKTQQKNERMAEKLGAIEARVSDYYAKINSLASANDSLNYNQISLNDLAAMSEANKDAMRATLKKVDDSLMAQAETFKDSVNIAIAYNLERQINANGRNEDVQVSVDGTVVMVNLSDELLFRSGSAYVSRKAYPVLEKLAAVINTEPAMQVLVEGHTDSQTVVEDSYLIDNWDLSLRRAGAVVRLLQNKFHVNPEKLIAAGRSSYEPLQNATMAENRRTTITILPNLDKFLALLDSTTKVTTTSQMDPSIDREKNGNELEKDTNGTIKLGNRDKIKD